MTSTIIQEEEGKLLNVIESLGKLEWRRFQSRYPSVWIDNKFQKVDHSGFPPVCSFRFAKKDSHTIGKLMQAVKSYRGKVEWVMIAHKRENLPGTNWMICTRRYWAMHDIAKNAGMPTGKYMAEYEPEFALLAHEDLTGLIEHVNTMLKFG